MAELAAPKRSEFDLQELRRKEKEIVVDPPKENTDWQAGQAGRPAPFCILSEFKEITSHRPLYPRLTSRSLAASSWTAASAADECGPAFQGRGPSRSSFLLVAQRRSNGTSGPPQPPLRDGVLNPFPKMCVRVRARPQVGAIRPHPPHPIHHEG